MPFFIFASYLWKLLKQKLAAVLLALSYRLREADSSARARGVYIALF